MSTQPIVTVTLDPAFDFQQWSENLATPISKLASDTRVAITRTSLNVALILRHLGERVCVTGILSEDSRATSTELFTEKELDNRCQYETSPAVCEDTWSGFRDNLEKLCETSEWFVIGGNMPNGISPRIYGQVTAILKQHGRRVIIDARGLALQAAIEARPEVIKTDLEQLEQWAGRKLPNSADQEEAICSLILKGIRHVVFTSKGKVQWFNPEQAWEARIEDLTGENPDLSKTTGYQTSDSLLAGIAYGLANKQQVADTLLHATTLFYAGGEQELQVSVTPLYFTL